MGDLRGICVFLSPPELFPYHFHSLSDDGKECIVEANSFSGEGGKNGAGERGALYHYVFCI
jgi:hypothetical protein